MSLEAGGAGWEVGVEGEGRYSDGGWEGRSGTGGVGVECRGGEPLGVWAVECGDVRVSSVEGRERERTRSGVVVTREVDVGDSVGTWTLEWERG